MSTKENPLAKWLSKAREIPAPPEPTEKRGRSKKALRQLNMKVSDATYERMKALAYRDRLSLVALLDAMLDLYEKERGKLEK